MNPYRMLIIDDESYVRNQLRSCIDWAQLGVEIVGEADNGLSGLALAEEHDPHIVICDIRMPYLDGVSFAQQLHERFPAAQIIFISAYCDKEQMQQAIRLNVVDYLFKPYKLSELSSALESAIQRLSTLNTAVTPSGDVLINLLNQLNSPAGLRAYLDANSVRVDFTMPFFCLIARPSVSRSHAEASKLIADSIERQQWLSRFTGSFQSLMQSSFGNHYEFAQIAHNFIAFVNAGTYSTAEECWSALSPLLAASDHCYTIGISKLYSSAEKLQESMTQALIQQAGKPSGMDNRDLFVLKAENYILSHLDTPLTVRQIAENIYVSHTYLCSLYKKKTGKTLNQFITETKMNHACTLLETTDKKIGEISAMLGYSNQNYFSKVFFHTFGIAPNVYRLRYRGRRG